MIMITYVNDCLFFGPDIKEIQKFIKELEKNGYNLTREDGDEDRVFSLLCGSIKPEKDSNMLFLTQIGLINKILEKLECNIVTLNAP